MFDRGSHPEPPLIASASIPRLGLIAALEGGGDPLRDGDGGDGSAPRAGLLGRPVALAPEPDGPQVIGEASGAAEAYGVRAGMRLAEALGRCPGLVLVAPDPARAETLWEQVLRRLEGIGAAVEPGLPGEAFFALEPLLGIHRTPEAVLAAARRALGGGVRLGAAPTRLGAHAAATRARAGQAPPILRGAVARRLVAALPVAVLRLALAWPAGTAPRRVADDRREWERLNLPETLERLGVRALGELARLPADAVADRFGEPGLRALRLARGADEPLRPRRPPSELAERIELPDAGSGAQLEHALELLIDRLLANPARRGRTLRRLRIEARLAGGGSWRTEAPLRAASVDPLRLRLALAPRLGELPAPAARLTLRATELGEPASETPPLTASETSRRRERIAEAARQARAVAGRDALLRVLDLDPESRVPERRLALTPFTPPAGG